jgi:hypothetical protein
MVVLPAEVAQLLNRCYALASKAIFDYDGTPGHSRG